MRRHCTILLLGLTVLLSPSLAAREHASVTLTTCSASSARPQDDFPISYETPEDFAAARTRAELELSRGNYAAAGDMLDLLATETDTRLLDEDARTDLTVLSALALARQGRPADAEARLDDLVRTRPNRTHLRDAQLHFYAGLVAVEKRDVRAAEGRLFAIEQVANDLALGRSRVFDAFIFENGTVEITEIGAASDRELQSTSPWRILRARADYLHARLKELEADITDRPLTRDTAIRDSLESTRYALNNSPRLQFTPWWGPDTDTQLARRHLDDGRHRDALRLAQDTLKKYPASMGGGLESRLRRIMAEAHAALGDRTSALRETQAAVCAGAQQGSLTATDAAPLLHLVLGPVERTDDKAVVGGLFRIAASVSDSGDIQQLLRRTNYSGMSGSRERQQDVLNQEIALRRLREQLRGLLAEGRSRNEEDIRIARSRLRDMTRELATMRSGQMQAIADVSLDSLQAVLRPDELYFRLVSDNDNAVALAVTRTSARAYRITDATRLQSQLQVIQESVLRTLRTANGSRTVEVLDDAAEAYQLLFGPAADLMAGARHLTIDVTGAAANVPFAMLLTRALTTAELATLRAQVRQSGGYNYVGVPWLARDRTISIVVDAAWFRARREESVGSRATKAFAAFTYPPVDEAMRDQRAAALATTVQQRLPSRYGKAECANQLTEVYSYQGIQSADAEATEAARALAKDDPDAATIVSGDNFTDARLLNFRPFAQTLGKPGGLEDYRVLAFYTHTQRPTSSDECLREPMLITSQADIASVSDQYDQSSAGDGLLTVSELLDLKFDADLIWLPDDGMVGVNRIRDGERSVSDRASSVRTQGISAGGVVGELSAGFFLGGARAVAGSYWTTSSDAHRKLSTSFFEAAAQGMPLADAMQTSQHKLMDDPDLSNPLFWAPFVILGDGSKTLRTGYRQ